ncbi:uncharacterized protein ARMOST_10169 [Armillaria ostoyae]|uniref:Uncharacterized protein n=1 Tax=Armillaria ostoyae TaxID=47428 RepID=A0A284RDI3_ARMOS|nr:uncharacterized protein ARMOST_10169 [Armillaria ostoyae]
MSSLSDEELDTVMAAILWDYPNYSRGLVSGALMWMESQLLHGACGLEHLTADDPRHVAPFAAVPNMGLNEDMLWQLQARQRVRIEAPDSVPRNLAYVACELPNNPFSPEQLVQFDARLNAVVPDVDRRMEYHRLHWIHGLAIMTSILSPSGQALPPDL